VTIPFHGIEAQTPFVMGRTAFPGQLERIQMMTIDVIALPPLAALIAGLLILIMPRLLNLIVAVYLILIGVIGLLPHLRHLLH
jgi:hypothetical protein